MPDHRNHRLYLADIADSSHAILEYTQGLSLEAFCRDRKTYSAVTREFEIIGEAVGKIPASIKQDYKHLVAPIPARRHSHLFQSRVTD